MHPCRECGAAHLGSSYLTSSKPLLTPFTYTGAGSAWRLLEGRDMGWCPEEVPKISRRSSELKGSSKIMAVVDQGVASEFVSETSHREGDIACP